MRKTTALILTTCVTLATSLPVWSGDAATDDAHVEKRVIALKTHDFELGETDISHLAIGDAKTIVTDDGRSIDILRTADGVEVYVDGELVAPAVDEHEGLEGDHDVVHRRVEVFCGEDGECEKSVWITDEDIDIDERHENHDTEVIVIRKEKPTEG